MRNHTYIVIRSIRHKGLKKYYDSGSKAGIQASHAIKIRLQLAALDTASKIEDMDIPGFDLDELAGRLRGKWSISANGNWRLTFEFRDGDVYLLDYEDYH
ncbi:MAG: proteic killer suppression protein [Gammaproteobacteria bacterium]|jgi:proteic killer suppression protein